MMKIATTILSLTICLTLCVSVHADNLSGFEVSTYAEWGDLTGDGFVGSSDLDYVRGNWNATVSPGTMGDASGDGFIGSADLDTVRANWGRTVSASVATTPEPTSLLIWGMFLVGMMLRRGGVRVSA